MTAGRNGSLAPPSWRFGPTPEKVPPDLCRALRADSMLNGNE